MVRRRNLLPQRLLTYRSGRGLKGPKSRNSFTQVYFVQACAPPYLVKIGQSLHPKQRLGDMAVGCPVGLVMVWHVPALTFGEQLLHAAFSNQWVRGEWFEPHPNLVRFVKDAKAAAPKMLAPEYVETNLVPLATYTGPEFEQYVWTYRKLFEGMPGYPDAPIGKGDGDFSHRL